MFRMLKRLAFAVLVPAVVGIGGWAGWMTFTTNVGMDETSAAELSPADVGPSGEWSMAGAADPSITPRSVADQKSEQDALRRVQPRMRMVRIAPEAAQAYADLPVAQDKPASVAGGTSGQSEAEQAQPPVQVASTDVAQASAASAVAQSKPVPAAERGSADNAPGGTREAERSPNSGTKAGTKDERQASLPREAQDDRLAGEQERERDIRRSQNDTGNPRKAIAAKREKADQATQQRSSAPAPRDHAMRLPGLDGIGPHEVRAMITELRRSRSIEDAVARFGAYGRPPWLQP